MKTLREFCFEESDAFPPERLAKLDVALQADHHAGMPWYLRVVVGFGAWVSSLFFLGSAIALVGWDHPNQTFIGILGCFFSPGPSRSAGKNGASSPSKPRSPSASPPRA